MFLEPSIPLLYSQLLKPKERQVCISSLLLFSNPLENFSFPLLLCQKGILAEPAFSQLIVPFILEMYQKNTKQVRLVLLDLIDCYITSVSAEDIQSVIMPQLNKGLDELDDELWVKNLCAIIAIAAVVLQVEAKKPAREFSPLPPLK